MKTKLAKRIVRAVEAGETNHSLATIRAAVLQVGRPIKIRTGTYDDTIYSPKGLKGVFYDCSNYGRYPHRPRFDGIVPYYDGIKDDYDYARPLEVCGTLTFEATAGSWRQNCIEAGTRLAHRLQAKVKFDFNGQSVVCRPRDTAARVEELFNIESERQHQEYINSDEYKESQRKRAERLAKTQAEVDALVAKLPDVVDNDDSIMDWAYDMAQRADDIGIVFDKQSCIATLEANGWFRNAMTLPLDAPQNERDFNRQMIESNAHLMAKYVIGQVIDCLYSNMPPHQVTMKFVDDYRKQRGTYVEPTVSEDYEEGEDE